MSRLPHRNGTTHMELSYEIFITRRPSGGGSISLDEWLRHVAGDAELTVADFGSGRVQWSGCEGRCLVWHDGQIIADDPDGVLIDKMLAIAQKIDAVVQGQDLEIYNQ
jgi:hypothetical protein